MSTNYQYQFEPKPRKSNYSDPVLSQKDEYIPKTHIGMYSIFRNPKNKNVYMSEEQCQKMRKGTFEGVLKLYKKYGSPNFADFFNYNSEVISEIGLNHFAHHHKINPVINLVECFEILQDLRYTKCRVIVSFAINRELLFEYFRTGHSPIIQRKYPKQRDLVIFGDEEINFDGSHSIRMVRNALYRRFEHWCMLQGVDMLDGVQMALESLFNAYPVENLRRTGEYDFLTEFDKPLFARPKAKASVVDRTVKLSGIVCAIADKILERYNRDTDNLTKRMDFDSYVNNALHLLNSNMDLKYRDPELYEERIKVKEFENHNLGQDNKGGW